MTRLALVAAVVLAGCTAREPATPFDGAAAYRYVQEQLAFGPRVPGTDAHRRAGDWIVARLRATADSVEVQAFTHVTAAGDSLPLRNVIGRFRPGAADRVLLLAHWDTRPTADQAENLGEQGRPIPGANDGASGVAVLLGVADVLARFPPSVGVDLLFVDGEDYGDFSGPDVLIGSTHYAAQLDPAAHPLFAVLFDMVGDADLDLFQESYSVQAAPEVVARVWETARRIGYGNVFHPEVRYAIRDDHIPLIETGVRAINVIDFEYGPRNRYWHTLEDSADKVSAESLQIVGDVAVSLVSGER